VGKNNYSARVLSRNIAHMQSGAYNFDFGNIDLMPPEITQMICVHMMSPHDTYHQMYFSELVRVSNTISYARKHNIDHGDAAWADFLLEVDDFDKFIQTTYTKFYASDSE
jgi:hypothetical protein